MKIVYVYTLLSCMVCLAGAGYTDNNITVSTLEQILQPINNVPADNAGGIDLIDVPPYWASNDILSHIPLYSDQSQGIIPFGNEVINDAPAFMMVMAPIIPEPATLAILALGAMTLLKRK